MTTFGYDAAGNQTSVLDALGYATTYIYDAANRRTQTDANTHTTSYQYDQRGRRTQRKLPLGQSESYAYHGNGNMSSKMDLNGKITTYTYDSMNRLLSKIPDASFSASPVTFTYTGAGQRSTMNDASGATSYGYDSWHRPAFKNTPAGQSSYGVDAAGNLTSQSVGSYTSFYGHDALNRLSTVTVQFYFTDSTATYGYDAVGNLQSLTYSNGVAHNYSYDAKNRLTNLGVTNGGATPVPIASYAYAVDNAGHRTGVTELGGRAVNYAYDNLYRLTNETISNDPNAMNGAVSYVYDAVGNRTQKVSTLPGYPGGLTNYNANDQIGTDTYDAEGNTTASNGTGYVYDFENHLIQANGITYVYDGDGNRVSKTVAGVTTTYLVDDQNPTGYAQVLQEQVQQSGVYPVEYVYGLEQFTRFRRFYDAGGNFNRETIFYEHDGHGSVRSLTDGNGTVLNTYDYDAFGNLLHSTGTLPNNYLFAGEQFDPDLNLYYNRARYLNTSTDRFWTMDRLEGNDTDSSSLHKYIYAEGSPVDNVDPSGNEGIAELTASFGASDSLNAISNLHYNPFEHQYRTASTISLRGIEFIRLQEDFFQYPDGKDGGGNCTIGYGHLIRRAPCTAADTNSYPNGITRDAAEQLLSADVYDKAVFPIKFLVSVPLAQKEFDALSDFTFNLGPGDFPRPLRVGNPLPANGLLGSTLLKRLNQGFYSAVPTEFRQYLRSGRSHPPGLAKRRNDEASLWNTGIYYITTQNVTVP